MSERAATLEDRLREGPVMLFNRDGNRIDLRSDRRSYAVAIQLFGNNDTRRFTDFISMAAFVDARLREIIGNIEAIDLHKLPQLVAVQERMATGAYNSSHGIAWLSVAPTAVGFRAFVRIGITEAVYTGPTLMAVMHFVHRECQLHIKMLENGLLQ